MDLSRLRLRLSSFCLLITVLISSHQQAAGQCPTLPFVPSPFCTQTISASPVNVTSGLDVICVTDSGTIGDVNFFGPGTLIIEQGAELTGGLTVQGNTGGTLIVRGKFLWNSAANLNQDFKIYIEPGGTIERLGDLTFNSSQNVLVNRGTLSISQNLTYKGELHNSGSISTQGVNLNSNNSLLVNQSGGRISVASFFNANGGALVENCGEIDIVNNLEINSGATFNNYCTVRILGFTQQSSVFRNYGFFLSGTEGTSDGFLHQGSSTFLGDGSVLISKNFFWSTNSPIDIQGNVRILVTQTKLSTNGLISQMLFPGRLRISQGAQLSGSGTLNLCDIDPISIGDNPTAPNITFPGGLGAWIQTIGSNITLNLDTCDAQDIPVPCGFGDPCENLSATLHCDQSRAITCKDSLQLRFEFTGTGPYIFRYSDGVANIFTDTSSQTTALRWVTPVDNSVFRLLSVSNPDNCLGSVCGEAVVYLNNCGIQKPCHELDFNTDANNNALMAGPLPAGTFSKVGLDSITATGGANMPWLFNSASPTGGDPDLGTPNQDFGGPGIGVGGQAGRPGANATLQGNILIVQEAGAVVPDDNSRGGTLSFYFRDPVELHTIAVLDIEENGAYTEVTNSNGNTSRVNLAPLGDNSYQNIQLNQPDVRLLQVRFPKSGAIASLSYCVPCPAVCVTSALVLDSLDSNGIRHQQVDFNCPTSCLPGDGPLEIGLLLPCADLVPNSFQVNRAQVATYRPFATDSMIGILINDITLCEAGTGRPVSLSYQIRPDTCTTDSSALMALYTRNGCITAALVGEVPQSPKIGPVMTPPAPVAPEVKTLGVYPNPARDIAVARLECGSCPDRSVTFSLYDHQGALQQSRTAELLDGEVQVLFNLSKLRPGLYHISSTETGRQEGKVLLKF